MTTIGRRSGRAARLPLLLLAGLVSACSASRPTPPAPDAPAAPPAAPWQGAPLAAGAIAPAYIEAWRHAENRSSCALIAFAGSDATRNATARTATFSGGWGVAFDRPELRSAFGVAGTGVDAAEPSYSDWPHTITWSDGSSAGYGPEGGTGPNHLAYLRIAGQGCLYNVWSRVGLAHLEELLGALRFVETEVR